MKKSKQIAPSNEIELNIHDEEAAHAASQPIIEEEATQVTEQEPDYITQLPEDILRLIALHLSPSDKFTLGGTGRAMHGLFRQSENFAGLLLLDVAHGEENKAKRKLDGNIRHLILIGHVEDFSGRKFRCSAFQYALWAGDWHMWNMMLTALDEADAHALPKSEFDAMSYMEQRESQGVITKEEIVAIRAELFEQYKAVVDIGLDYTITRYQREQNTAGEYQLINPRTVGVNAETHFDLKGPEFCLMPQAPNFTPKKGKLYIRIEDGVLHYKVIALSGELVNNHINLAALQCPLVQLDSPAQLKPYIHNILKITAEAEHTHPQALTSAFETYVYGETNNWTEAQLIEQWCGGVGMAEREVPVVIAQQMCREVLFDTSQGEFKDQDFRFYRKLRYYIWGNGYASWFPLDSSNNANKLGLYFGILNYWSAQGSPIPGVLRPSIEAPPNLAALSALYAERVRDRASLRDQLDPEKRQDLIVGQEHKMS